MTVGRIEKRTTAHARYGDYPRTFGLLIFSPVSLNTGLKKTAIVRLISKDASRLIDHIVHARRCCPVITEVDTKPLKFDTRAIGINTLRILHFVSTCHVQT
jgi:hypothetical protein